MVLLIFYCYIIIIIIIILIHYCKKRIYSFKDINKG